MVKRITVRDVSVLEVSVWQDPYVKVFLQDVHGRNHSRVCRTRVRVQEAAMMGHVLDLGLGLGSRKDK